MRSSNEIHAYLEEVAKLPKNAAVLYEETDHTGAQGSYWARAHIQRHYKDETYQLQIDSHMRFYGEWDTKLVE